MRRDIQKMRGARCERCGSTRDLELHHKTYDRLGRELLSDLELLCSGCHAEADQVRAAKGRVRSEAAKFSAGLDTYGSKKYGDDWEVYRDPDAVAEEFSAWLERKDEI
jgi:5-methylcytosine-specific restriction endonuclease McrA